MDIGIDGVVIREVTINEGDKLLTVLTGSLGKITVKARGVKNIKSKNSPGTQIFCYSELELSERSGRYTLKTASVKDSFFGIRSDIGKYALACYFADIVSAVTTENNDEEQVLRLLLNALYALSNKEIFPLWHIKGAFELKLMVLSGFMPELFGCGMCGKDITEQQTVLFSFREGYAVCGDCEENVKKTTGRSLPFCCQMTQPVLYAMRYVSQSEISKFLSFRLDEDTGAEFAFICENYLINQVERSFDTLRFYKSMQNV